jgi:hydroxyethylthiazole kinase-like uncharacterized protein yjeF
MALLQNKRAKALGIKKCTEIEDCDVLVDAIVGTGFNGEFNKELNHIMQKLNKINAHKITCDVPSGLKPNGECTQNCFMADVTLSMGALKKSLFLDEAKDFVGEIKVLDLGVTRKIYETPSNWNLLDLEDIKIPFRDKKNTHKGSFGHLAVITGEKTGAGILCASAALRFGAGLVTIISEKDINIPYSLMSSKKVPQNTTAVAIGMGLGRDFQENTMLNILSHKLALLIDADVFYMPIINEILKRDNLVITPHPKEFVELLKRVHIADISIIELQKNRFKYVELFCKKYPNVALLLKGANVIIGQNNEYFINPHGSSKLAKGGSGDVLAGLAASLLAQGYHPLEALKSASLAHTKLALNFDKNDFSLTPEDLINGISNL